MTADNFTTVLNSVRQLQPFHVFTVELHGGRRFEVDHPGTLVVRDGVAVFLAPGGVLRQARHWTSGIRRETRCLIP